MSAQARREPCLYRFEQAGSDATGLWFADAQIVHGLLLANLGRSKRRHKANVKMTLDEAEHYAGSVLAIVRNERERQRRLGGSA